MVTEDIANEITQKYWGNNIQRPIFNCIEYAFGLELRTLCYDALADANMRLHEEITYYELCDGVALENSRDRQY